VRKVVIGALTIGVLLITGALRVADFWSLREGTLKSAESRAANLALILSEYITGSFATGDASLRQLAVHGQRIGGPAASARDWAPSLATAGAGLTTIGSVSVVDAEGVIRHSTLPAIVGQSRRDVPLFDLAQRAVSDQLLVGAPYRSPVDPDLMLIPLGRRLTRPDGAFDGMVVASFLPTERRDLFRSVNVGARGSLWVIHPDGPVIFREPSHGNPIGESARDHPLFIAATRAGAPGIVRASLEPGGPEMVAAFHIAQTAPLIVAVALNRDEVLADWRRLARGSALVFLVTGILLALTLLVLFRQIDQKTAAERELEETRRLEADRLRTANQHLAATLEREQQARRDAEEANKLKEQFVMTVSHELRTPLTAIAGWARMLVDGMVGEDKRDAALRTIERNAQAQRRLIEDLLDISGVTSGKLRLDIRPVAVADIVRMAVETIAPAVEAKKLRLETTIDPAVGVVAGDPERLQQIIWNLLSNAVKFTASGGQVGIAVTRRRDEIEIVVTDTGSGISPEFLPHVFERFRQAHTGPSRHHGGLGLGLAIVRNLVELHGGTVTAHSEGEGHGATFIVRLPAPASVPAPVGP
jgi:signal transduction histidine kinase